MSKDTANIRCLLLLRLEPTYCAFPFEIAPAVCLFVFHTQGPFFPRSAFRQHLSLLGGLLLEVVKEDGEGVGLLSEVGDDCAAAPDGLLDLSLLV